MLLERTLLQLDIGKVTSEQAVELGALGYRQWLSEPASDTCYAAAAESALALATPLKAASPAVAVFCGLIERSLEQPLTPLPLVPRPRRRRGGAPVRRRQRML